ncbi:MAG TPA: aminotransferase class V-fold PLP-dependent enzyme, partial [Planctomycetota bacterium]|nr:aminotransferase class V-fold PLP-dependent enzyme [Planctomycetota bacterium]
MYLDANATTRLDDDAFQAMLPWLREEYGNPSSVHDAGKRARRALEDARATIAQALGCHADEVTFFASATEATNALIVSAVNAARGRLPAGLKPLILTSPAEHECVLKPCEWLAQTGLAEVRMIPVDGAGRLKSDLLRAAVQDQADATGPGRIALASFMLANNETGVIEDLAPIVELCRARRISVHSDGVQALGKIAVKFAALGVDYLTLAPHKCGGPKGVGILIARRVAPLEPWVRGGPQEGGVVGGTENVAAIAGAAVAVMKAVQQQASRAARWAPMRDALEARIVAG